MPLTREQRRERRRRIMRAAVQLGHELFPEDEGQRKEWLASTISAHINIPLLNEKQEKAAIAAVIDIIEDLVD